ncbi:glycosyltransferase [Glutamicibacter uratoxydans]|uniref:glycosyltransferase n=1 Tax=Glutamicibacter uratoxydans TaxID=43667 RepID=UPI003D6F7DC8
MSRKLAAIAIVVPAHNEQELLNGCLESIRDTMNHFARLHPAVHLSCTVVCDACTDNSEQLVAQMCARDSRFTLVRTNRHNVGAARALAVDCALQRIPTQIAAEQMWLASTDADTRVPEHWLEEFALLHRHGAQAVTGTVEPEYSDLDPERFARWKAAYQPVAGHQHIHGANLGVIASAYLAVGGFAALTAHEDVKLIEDLRAANYRVVGSERLQVVTSGRLEGRVNEGFAKYLAALQPEATPVP